MSLYDHIQEIRKHPGLEVNDKGTMEELRRLLLMRQRFINYVAETKGVGFSEAERIVDAP